MFAAGNTGSNNDIYRSVPSRYAELCRENTVVVMASDWYDDRPTFSNFGPEKVADLGTVRYTRARRLGQALV